MRIAAAIAAYSPEPFRKSAGVKEEPVRAAKKSDSVEISAEGRKRLQDVKGRIEDGYYNSDKVAEDISEKLSGIMDDIVK